MSTNPDHYKWRNPDGPEPREVILDHNLSFYPGCVVKYIYRYPRKGRILDVEKAITCIEFLLELPSEERPDRTNRYWDDSLGERWGLSSVEQEIISNVLYWERWGNTTRLYAAYGAAIQLRRELIAEHNARLNEQPETD